MTEEKRGFACVALDNPKDNKNVGSALRAAGCFGASMIVTSGKRYSPQSTDTMKAYRHRPLIQTEDVFDVIPYDCVPVAVDLVEGASNLFEYEHPERAFYIFGAEDATLGNRIIKRCRDVIYIPTNRCMNLAATVNVVLYDRAMKESLRKSQPEIQSTDKPAMYTQMVGRHKRDLEKKCQPLVI